MKRHIDFDRDRRPELHGLLQKADTLARELYEVRLREDVLPPIQQAERVLEKRKEKEVRA